MIEYAVRTNSMGHITFQAGLNMVTAMRLTETGNVAGVIAKEVVSREVSDWQTVQSFYGSVCVD